MATIWKRGPYQFCARVRRNGVSETETFETKTESTIPLVVERRSDAAHNRVFERNPVDERPLDVGRLRRRLPVCARSGHLSASDTTADLTNSGRWHRCRKRRATVEASHLRLDRSTKAHRQVYL